jgi:hypothetical protein
MKKIIIISILMTLSVIAQKAPKISDTLSVITLERFSVPKDKQIVLTNIKESIIRAELLDKNFKKIRNIKEIAQSPSQRVIKYKSKGGRGVMVQYNVYATIEEPGEYFVKIEIKYRDEKGDGKASAYYKVDASYPMANNEISLRENYYYSERETMSFATADFADISGYSYKIIDVDNNELAKGVGPIVKLDGVMSDIKNLGKEITVVGYYHDRQFFYKYNGFDFQKSEWKFTLNKPNIEEFDDWKKSSPDQVISLSAWNKNAMRFLYTYTGNTPNGFVVVYPEIKNFKFTGEPANMFTSPKYSRAGNFLYVTFKLNEEYLDNMEDYSEQQVNIKVAFTTQFGEKIEKEYDGTILK